MLKKTLLATCAALTLAGAASQASAQISG